MKPWHESVRPGASLRQVRLTGFGLAVNEAERQRQELEKTAFERGRQAGEKALSEQLLQQRREILELHSGVLRSLEQALPELIRDCERDLVALAVEVARKLVSELPISVEMVEAAVRQALAQVQESSKIQVWLHADDLALLHQFGSSVLGDPAAETQIHFGSSPEVTRGGCLVQTRFGTVDGRRETKLDILKQTLQP
jgi:flagellar assembly protein FliH